MHTKQRQLFGAPDKGLRQRNGEASKGETQQGFDEAVMSEKRMSAGARCLGFIVLSAYMGLLVYLSLHKGRSEDSAGVPLWGLQDSHRLVGWAGGFVLRAVCRFAFFIPLGFMVTMLVAGSVRGLPRLLVSLSALVIGAMLAVVVQVVATGWSWHWVAAAGLVLPLMGCLFGIWMGSTWLRGWRARLWLVPKTVLLVVLIALCTGIIFVLLVEARPLSFAAAPVASAEKRRLVDLIRSKSPRSLREGQTETLRLTEHDIGVLLSWGLSLGSPNRKAKVSFAHDSATMRVSVGVPLGSVETRYLNFVVAARADTAPGVLNLHIDRCRLGSLELPRRLLNILSPMLTSFFGHWRLSQPFLDATREIAIETGSIEVTYGRVRLRSHGLREEIFGSDVLSEAILASTRAQVDNLLAVVRRPPSTAPEFGLCFETVFALARERSIARDPVAENRAGIFALGMLLGHHRFEDFLGPVHAGHRNDPAQRALRRVVLRGRSDWTKHFCLSAAICLLSDEVVSDAAGLLKEELDAGAGGSGFSFADLLADQAGTTFAAWAVRDEATARALQDRLTHGFHVDDFFPEAAGLPEGISDAKLQSQYGGVDGEGYARIIEEIARRIANCAAYRP